MVKLGNIGTLSSDAQLTRINKVLGEKPCIKTVNIHNLTVQTNLAYGTILILLQVGLEIAAIANLAIEKVVQSELFANLSVLKQDLKQKQVEPIILDELEMEKMEIIEDQPKSSQSTPSQENAKNPKKKKSRKSKKQKKQPEDNQPAKLENTDANQGKINKSKGKKFTRSMTEKVDEKTKEIPDRMGQDHSYR
ncbi:hypothetical protein RclHR1_00160019 [Rhizophagus clarus]|uniref:Uncharacterized protein n=1 Tax=Rhizophagus clarus TaxID=94130 RepID=A0A2Z6QGJ4_9GLOM|nr:hypothetical protein RclHR1_00160019 [Rhizophagus clarus]GES81096.1 hypothetical protein RCL_jg17938.t1 [Rhizophagus clarus]